MWSVLKSPDKKHKHTFKLHQIWSVYSQENNLNSYHQVSYFNATTQQIRFWQELYLQPHW